MGIESKYEKGNVLMLHRKRTIIDKVVVVHLIESWHYQRGFTYLVYEPVDEFHLFERLDDDELDEFYDVDGVFKNYDEYQKVNGCK